MKRVRKTITADTQEPKNIQLSTEARYSNADILLLLLAISDLQMKSISAKEKEDGSCDFVIGDMTYNFVPAND